MSALAVEAGVSRRTAGRAKGVLWDFEDAIVRRDRSLEAEPNGEAARLRGELSGTLTKLQQKNAEITRLRAELKACRVALLSEENEQLRRFRHWTGGHTPVVRECRVMTDQEPPVLAPMLAGATGMPTDPTGWIFEPTGTASEESAALVGRFTITSRLGNDVTAAYPELAALAVAGDHAVVLDAKSSPSTTGVGRASSGSRAECTSATPVGP